MLALFLLTRPYRFFKIFWKKKRLQDFGSWRIKQFLIDCTPLLKTIFQKNILWFFFLSPQRVTQKFSKFFWKKWKCKILDLGESNNFLSIAPHFQKTFFKKIFSDFFTKSLTSDKKFFKVFWKKKWKCRILDLGKSNNFLLIAPHFWKPFFKKIFCDFILSPWRATKIFLKFFEKKWKTRFWI